MIVVLFPADVRAGTSTKWNLCTRLLAWNFLLHVIFGSFPRLYHIRTYTQTPLSFPEFLSKFIRRYSSLPRNNRSIQIASAIKFNLSSPILSKLHLTSRKVERCTYVYIHEFYSILNSSFRGLETQRKNLVVYPGWQDQDWSYVLKQVSEISGACVCRINYTD